MLSFGPATQIYLHSGIVDMRKSYNGLAALVRTELEQDPLSGHVFAFSNRRRNLAKILVFERGGFWVLAKRLEKGTFAWPKPGDSHFKYTNEQLTLLLAGLDLAQTKERRWHKQGRKSMPQDDLR